MDSHDPDATLTPPRLPGSVRRTMSIDMTWPGGVADGLRFEARGRDLQTDPGDRDREVAAERFVIELTPDQRIRTLTRTSGPGSWPELVGIPARSGFRRALRESGVAATAGNLAHALLDDLPPSSIIANFPRGLWPRDPEPPDAPKRVRAQMAGLCAGFAPGSSALNPDGTSHGRVKTRQVAGLARADDPRGWHEFAPVSGMATRRARRIDVGRDDDGLWVDAALQDSATMPDGGRVAVHEYRVRMRVDEAGLVESAAATWANLPYQECPGALGSVDLIVGTPVAELRTVVLERIRGTVGCTHLSDVLRALADVPALAGALAA